MDKIVYRKNKLFCIDKTKLKPEARKEEIYSALYAALYLEFLGASYNQEYSNLTALEKLVKINEFANNWLEQRGLK